MSDTAKHNSLSLFITIKALDVNKNIPSLAVKPSENEYKSYFICSLCCDSFQSRLKGPADMKIMLSQTVLLNNLIRYAYMYLYTCSVVWMVCVEQLTFTQFCT